MQGMPHGGDFECKHFSKPLNDSRERLTGGQAIYSEVRSCSIVVADNDFEFSYSSLPPVKSAVIPSVRMLYMID